MYHICDVCKGDYTEGSICITYVMFVKKIIPKEVYVTHSFVKKIILMDVCVSHV